MKIVTIANSKGGVGKTTTTQAMLEGFQKRGFKVLGIDMDPQGNLSSVYHYEDNGKTIFDVLKKEPISNCIIKTQEGIDLIQGDFNLSNVDKVFTEMNKDYLLKEAIEPIKNNYDFILIDTPPFLNTATTNAMTCSNTVLIPLLADFFSIQGLAQLFQTIQAVQVYRNPNLKIDGILVNQYQGYTNLNQEIANELEKISNEVEIPIFEQKIRYGIAIKGMQKERSGILNSPSNVANDFQMFIDEYLRKERIVKNDEIL